MTYNFSVHSNEMACGKRGRLWMEPVKITKEDTIPDVEKNSQKKTAPLFRHKVDYKGYTNEKTRDYNDSPGKTDGCVINLSKEHENEEDK